MRAFSVIALCFLAASANAFSIDGLRDCIKEELSGRLNKIIEEVNFRLDKVSTEGGDVASKARQHFREKSDAFKEAMTEPLSQARADFDECMKTSNRVVCTISMGKDLVTKVLPIATEKTLELVDAINEISADFRDNRKEGMDELRQKGREFAKSMMSSLRGCFSQ